MKKLMTRVAALTLVLAVAASLVACGSKSDSASTSASTSSSTSTSASVPEQVEIDFNKNLTEDGLWQDINMADFVTLGEYKDMTIPSKKVNATEEEIEAQRQSFVQQFGTPTKITDQEVKDGDHVNIDYVGSVDGVEFTGGNTQGKGTSVVAGSTNYIDDFLTQIIGHKPGETVNVEVTFPEDYNDSTDSEGNTIVLAGKDAVFVTTINYIEGDPVYPEFNDEFVSTNLKAKYGWETAEQANEDIKSTITEFNKAKYLQEHLLKECKVKEIPETIVETLLQQEVDNMNNSAAMNGIPVEYLLAMYGFQDMDAFRENFRTSTQDQIKMQMIYQLIAETEGLLPTEESMKEMFGENYETAIESYNGTAFIKHQMLIENGYNFVMENNEIG